jgi:pimeloyl-ACP methyl ester carboxylesterase
LGALPFVGEGLMATVGAVIAPGMIEATVRKALQPDDAKSSTTFVTDRQRRFNVPRSLTVHSRQQVTDAAGLTEIAARLGAVRVPSVIIGCAQDAFEGAELDSRRLARELPGATLEWLEGCGHYVQVGRPDVVIGAVARLRATAEPSRP